MLSLHLGRVGRWAGVAAAAGPALWAAWLLPSQLATPLQLAETGGPPGTDPMGPLQAEAQFQFLLPDAPGARFDGIALSAATYYTHPGVRFEVCASVGCAVVHRAVQDNAILPLPFVSPVSPATAVKVTVLEIQGGALALWGTRGHAWSTGYVRRPWGGVCARARRCFAALGIDAFWPLLVAYGLVLGAVAVLGAWRCLAGRSTLEPRPPGSP